jgi:phosphohistidine phosphatase SixA
MLLGRWIVSLFLVAILSPISPAEAEEAAWQALKRPGAIALMRHALAPGTGDPPNFVLGDCATQRNLDARGREQARQIGAALREQGIVFDRVLTSQWCRCRETAELLNAGPVENLPALNSFFADSSTRSAQTAATEAFLRALPDTTRVLLVTHQVNITALTGVFPASGEVVVGAMGPAGFVVAERLLIAP